MGARFTIPGFRGQLIHAGDAGYDEARTVFNAMVDRRPAVIARCTCTEDVGLAVDLAREQRLPLSVYGGGHGVTGAAVCDDGVVVDLRAMKGIDVDPQARTVRAEGGLTWGEFDAATQAHGLAVTGGRVSTTGIAGLALGSGSGWLERKLGFTCDNLLKAEVVTADGRVVFASEEENNDLFWAIRGGGGNFGIVTAFHLGLHPIGPVVLGGMLVFTVDMARDAVRAWRDFMRDAPDEVGTALAFVHAPPEEFVPEPLRMQPVVGIVCCYAGPVEEGERALRPLRDLAPGDIVAPMPYVAVQQLLDPANPKGRLNYWSGDFLEALPDDAVDILVEHGNARPSPFTQIIVIPGGGAPSRVPDDATAFGQRDAPFNIHYLSMWEDPAATDANVAYTRRFADAMRPWATGRAYLNFLGDEGPSRVEAAFGPDKFARLQALKDKWDPENLFRHNQNIPPSG
jgi:FAD/FMN-containing dehydrogenase